MQICTYFFLGLKKKEIIMHQKRYFVHAFSANYCQFKILLSCVLFFACNLLHFKTFVLQKGHCGDDKFLWTMAKISFVYFFL
jgi:hypothetical protein